MNMQPATTSTDEPEYPGFADYECRNAIRAMIRIYGVEAAWEKIANQLQDEAKRSRRQ